MATFVITAHHAQLSSSGGFQVIFHLTGKADPFPKRTIEAKTTAEALAALEAYKGEAALTGLPMAISIHLKAGRSPPGFKAATNGASYYHRLNI